MISVLFFLLWRSFLRGSAFFSAYVYDGLGRISRRTVNAGGTGVATTYGYLAGGHGTGSTTPLVQTITQSGTMLTYAYDDAGNITSVSDGVKTISYAYDLLGQLIRANDPYDATAGSNGTTWVYAYDLGGNILSKTAYAYTTGTVGTAVKTDSYSYGDANWKDKLTAINGAAISYDAIGNPLSDGTWTYTWAKGRQLQSMSKSGETVSFTYNEDGLRVQKVATSTGTTKYTLHGKNIVHMTSSSNTLHFFYDAQNKPAVVLFNGIAYAYLYNLQGDVIALVDANGSKVVEYKYDAWGRPLSKAGTLATTLGTLQPFRYRGYAYDEETCCYYLYNRYYSPKWSRFINADAANLIVDTSDEVLGANLFSYCENDPVNCHDESGNFSLPNWAKVAIGAVVIAGLAIATVATAGTAAVVCGTALSGAVAGATSEAVVGAVTGVLKNGWEGAIDGACSGFLSGTVIGGVSGAASAGFNILTKATRIVGKAHGTILHKLSSNMQAGRMASSGRYSQIGLNKALKTMGLNGGLQRPDVIGIGKNGTSKLVEVVSLKQNELSVMNKMSKMLAANPNSTGKVVMWVRNIGKTLY